MPLYHLQHDGNTEKLEAAAGTPDAPDGAVARDPHQEPFKVYHTFEMN